ncbi:MAG: hypothetical protein V8R80_07460 [Eubacterium sp.]
MRTVTPADGSALTRTTFRILAIIIVIVMVVCSFFFVKPGADFIPPAAANKKGCESRRVM